MQIDIFFYYSSRINKAIHAYHEKNNIAISKKEGRTILLHPVDDRDERYYYSVWKEVFEEEKKTLEEGIRDMVQEYYTVKQSSAEEEDHQIDSSSLAWLTDFHLPPISI